MRHFQGIYGYLDYLWLQIANIMKTNNMKHFFVLFAALMLTLGLRAQNFTEYFVDKTLRIDYTFTGDATRQEVSVDQLSSLPRWAGRRRNLSELPLRGNGQVTVRDKATQDVIYKTSFSSLFQEWLSTDEAKTTFKSFENTFLVPMPRSTAEIELTLTDPRGNVVVDYKHTVDPSDILIREKGTSHVTPYRYIHQSGSSADCIDIAILAEGYTEEEMDIFYKDAEQAAASLFNHEPFKSMKQHFNIVAVASPSKDSGVSIPRLGKWKQTAFSSHFSTFYSDRYLTTSSVKDIHEALAGIDYEHIIILANTTEYGGGGIYNSYTLTAAHDKWFNEVVVHEFGHSFGGLADEYFYEGDVMDDTYPTDAEPWERNVTTLVDFKGKWESLIPSGTPMPTPVEMKDKVKVGLYEGAAYSFHGLYRASYNCRMRTNEHPEFCPSCQKALTDLINFYVK